MAETLTGQPMDEVLASIRRIITEDKPVAALADMPVAEEEVLELGAPPPPASDAETTDGLLSADSAEASRNALAQLAGLAIDPDAPANSLDGLVREMLRPMLKTWLDAHLPEIVERMVAREIARIGGR